MKKILLFSLVFAALFLGGQGISAQSNTQNNIVYSAFTRIDTFVFSPELEVRFKCLWTSYYSSRGLNRDTTKSEAPQGNFKIVITHSNDASANRRTYLQVLGADNCGRIQIAIDSQTRHIFGENKTAGEFVFGYCPDESPCFSFSAPLGEQRRFKQELKKLYSLIAEAEMDMEFN